MPGVSFLFSSSLFPLSFLSLSLLPLGLVDFIPASVRCRCSCTAVVVVVGSRGIVASSA